MVSLNNTIMAIITKLSRFSGSRYFHSSIKSWSIRNLGNVHRNHIIKKISISVFAKNQNTPNNGIDSVIPKGDK
jgi:DNA primase catalytic subunit